MVIVLLLLLINFSEYCRNTLRRSHIYGDCSVSCIMAVTDLRRGGVVGFCAPLVAGKQRVSAVSLIHWLDGQLFRICAQSRQATAHFCPPPSAATVDVIAQARDVLFCSPQPAAPWWREAATLIFDLASRRRRRPTAFVH